MKDIKLLENITGENLWGLRLGKGFLDLTTMAQSITKKMGKSPKLIFLFCFAKTPFKRMKS